MLVQLVTGGTQTMKLKELSVILRPNQVILKELCIIMYTRNYVARDSDKVGGIHHGQLEFQVQRIGHQTMMEKEDAVPTGYEADVAAHLLRHKWKGDRSGLTIAPVPLRRISSGQRVAHQNMGKNHK